MAKIKPLNKEILRQHKGISFVGVSTCFICYDDQKRIFLAQRSKNSRDEHGKWDNGGGGLKVGQTLIENLKRELKEEYTVDPIKIDFLTFREVFRDETTNNQKTHWIAFYYLVKVDHDQVRINEPDMFDDSDWFTIDNLPIPLHHESQIVFKEYYAEITKIINKNINNN